MGQRTLERLIRDHCGEPLWSYCATACWETFTTEGRQHHYVAVCCGRALRLYSFTTTHVPRWLLFSRIVQIDHESIPTRPSAERDVFRALHLKDAFNTFRRDEATSPRTLGCFFDSNDLTLYVLRDGERFRWRADRYAANPNPVEQFVDQLTQAMTEAGRSDRA
jgi:hypothetical protein